MIESVDRQGIIHGKCRTVSMTIDSMIMKTILIMSAMFVFTALDMMAIYDFTIIRYTI